MLDVGSQFIAIDWTGVPEEQHPGERGNACWRVKMFKDTRVRLVTYSGGYVADHWCARGHILHVVSGELHTELRDGRKFSLTAGMTYVVGDAGPEHRSRADVETRLFIVD